MHFFIVCQNFLIFRQALPISTSLTIPRCENSFECVNCFSIFSIPGQVRSRALELIGSAYSSITTEALAKLLGETPSQALASAVSQPGWQVVDNMVLPVRPPPPHGPSLTSEDQLEKLTQFVSFLEN
jgi:hypothetical protein